MKRWGLMLAALITVAAIACLLAATACGGGSTPATPVTPQPTQVLSPFPPTQAPTVLSTAVAEDPGATAFHPSNGPPVKPTGKETHVRIQPRRDRVACSGDKQAVDIFLDDLPAAASGATPGVSVGLAGFQLTLRYDPSILRVETPDDAELNPALTTAETAGGQRAFIPAPATIDNLEGYVFLAAVGIPQGEPFDPRAAGIDPVASREPILLFTVGFQTVGEGTSLLTVYTSDVSGPEAEALGVEFLDYGGRQYTPFIAEDSSMAVTAGDCAPAVLPTPRPRQPLPTPVPTRTPIVVPTPQVVTPTPAALAGRPDCPQGWNAYNDPDDHFSFCYPLGVAITTRGAIWSDREGTLVVVSSGGEGESPSENGFYLTMVWQEGQAYNPQMSVLALADYCRSSVLVALPESTAPVREQIAGRLASGCLATGTDNGTGPTMKVIDVTMPVGSAWDSQRGHVSLMIQYVGPDLGAAEAAGQAVIDTLVIPDN